jgi:hypothetical protein
MKSLFIIACLALGSLAARADIIKCTYTEPGISTTYSMTQSKFTIVDHSAGITNVIRNVSFQILDRGRFELWNSNRRVVQRMYLNYEGSDGMSSRRYPYQGRRGGQWGGCTSNFLHATGGD